MTKLYSIVLGCVGMLLAVACGGSATSMTASQTVAKMLELQQAKDFDAYVEYLDIDDAEVKAQLAQEFKIALGHLDEVLAGLQSYKVVREELSEDGTQATVYALMTFKKNKPQEVVLNMVQVDGQWKMKQL
ncbi:MAG: DUF4878 domain-containing protein [Rikenellaceae bacterium]